MSLKDFFKPPQKFISSPEPTNPFDAGHKIWDERDGDVRVENYNLRRIIFGLVVVCVILAGGFIFQSMKATVSPYVIEVDSTTGMARNVGTVESQKYEPKEAEIKYFLTDFIKNTRGIPLDPVVYTQNWNKAYSYMTKGAAAKMDTLMQNEVQNLGKKTVQPNILVMVPMGNNSYQVRWTEEEFSIGSGKKTVVPMSGVFTVYLSPPKDKKEIDMNPLGIYFSDFNWAKETVTSK